MNHMRTGAEPDVAVLLAQAAAAAAHQEGPLHWVASRNYLAAAHRLVTDGGVPPASLDQHGCTALHAAAAPGHAAMAAWLLDIGAPINVQNAAGKSALTLAAERRQLAVCCLLLARGAAPTLQGPPHPQLLLDAAEAGEGQLVSALIAAGSPLDERRPGSLCTALTLAAYRGHAHVVRLLVSGGACLDTHDAAGQTAAGLAVRGGHVSILRALLEAGADPDAAGQGALTPLVASVMRSGSSAFEALLEAGADVNLEPPVGPAPLAAAAAAGRLHKLRALLARGAAIDGGTLGRGTGTQGASPTSGTCPPLVAAASRRRYDVLKELLSQGADLEARDVEGRTALMAAAAAGHVEAVRMLLACGAAPNNANAAGQTAAGMARSFGTSAGASCHAMLARPDTVFEGPRFSAPRRRHLATLLRARQQVLAERAAEELAAAQEAVVASQGQAKLPAPHASTPWLAHQESHEVSTTSALAAPSGQTAAGCVSLARPPTPPRPLPPVAYPAKQVPCQLPSGPCPLSLSMAEVPLTEEDQQSPRQPGSAASSEDSSASWLQVVNP